MATNPLVSVIIPVFNTHAEYMKVCFDSIKNQTYEHIEVVIVDDGSKQEVADFLDAYTDRLAGWHVHHIENGGVSRARNYGVKQASGDFIQFIDSDDFLEKETLESCIKLALEENSDLVLYSIAQTDEKLQRIDYVQDYGLLTAKYKPFTIDSLNSSEVFILEQILPNPTNKIISRNLLVDNNIVFPLGIRIGEDHVFSFLTAVQAKRISVIDEPFYKYRIFPTSSMGGAYRYPTDVIDAFRIIKDGLDEHKLLIRWADSFIDFIISNVRYNRWCFGDHYDAIEELFVAANKLIEEISPGVVDKLLEERDETVTGLLIAKQDTQLLKEYFTIVYANEKKERELRDAIHAKNELELVAAENTQSVEEVPGIKQSARDLARAVKRRVQRGVQR